MIEPDALPLTPPAASPASLAAFLGSAEALTSRLRAAAEAAGPPDDVDMSDAELSPPKASETPAMMPRPWATPAAAATPAGVSPLPPTPATPLARCSPEGAELQRFLSSAEALKSKLRRAIADDGDDAAASELRPTALVL
jgi:hypothetical protein